MRLRDVTATPHPNGNRIEVSWTNPDPVNYPGVRVIRRERTHPTSPEDGVIVAQGVNLPFIENDNGENDNGERSYTVSDQGLKGETVHYYTLFPYQTDPEDYVADRHNRASAMATSPYDMPGQMMALLPTIYHRYDSAGLPAGSEHLGQLRRFLDIPGSQLDQLYSFARAALNLYDIDRVDGRLLPLLGQWNGWDTNFRLDIATQRNELRSAPALYQTIGIVPTVEATVKRVLGWESRAKEFLHNIALSNSPERLNIWTHRRDTAGVWSASQEPLSLDYSYEGRPSAVYADDGVMWLFYHTRRNNCWDIWYKTLTMFSIPEALQDDLNHDIISTNLLQAFEDGGFPISQNVIIETREDDWQIEDGDSGETYTVRLEDGQLNVYRWTPSSRLTDSDTVDKHPTALYHNSTLYLYWDSFHEPTQTWRILYRTMSGGEWSAVQTFGDDDADRRNPAILFDQTNHLWAFWLEKDAPSGRWQLRYARRDDAEWNLGAAHTFPLDAGVDPKADSDLFVLFQPAAATPDATPRIWVFWSRKVPTGADRQTRWQIAYRVATGIDPNELTWIHTWSPETPDHLTVDFNDFPINTSFQTWFVNKPLDWGPVHTLPETVDQYSAREPAAFFNAAGSLELFFSSNADRSWSVWNTTLQSIDPPTWDTPQEITPAPYSQRAPFPAPIVSGTMLFYRSNDSVRYGSEVYRATETIDYRYAGSTSVDTRNVVKMALHERFDDFQTYVYDTARTDRDWYARDTVGIYLDPDTEDPQVITRNRNLINNVLRQFLPIQVRIVFIIPIISRERVYTYEFPGEEPQRVIGEQFFDSMDTIMTDTFSGITDQYLDTMAGWVWVRSWSPEFTDHFTVDFDAEQINTNFRTVHVGLLAGG